jgi:hypothetical protein
MTRDILLKYLGQPWTEEHDCYYWFCEIQRREFGRKLPPLAGNHRVLNAARLMRDEPGILGWSQTAQPKEGDAAFLAQKSRPHHIGVVVFIGGKHRILHALEGSGVILSDATDLRINGWIINGYWTHD